MALRIGISSFVSGGYTNPVAWRLYETGSGAFVDEHNEPGPHGVVYNFSFVNNLRDIVYTCKMYEVPGGIGVGLLIKSEDITVSTSTITFDADIETIVDAGTATDPVSGTSTSPAIAELIGKDYYVVQRSIGQRRIVRQPEVTIDNTVGTYSLLGGETFNADDTWIIKVRPQFVINPAGSQGIGIYKDVVLVNNNLTLSGTDFGKLLIVDGIVNVVTLQLPVQASILSKISLFIESVGTNHIYVVVKAAIGETLTFNGTTSNTFIMGRATRGELILLSGTLYAMTDDVDIKKRGQFEWGFYQGINRLIADGTEYLTADYPGLFKAIQSMPAGEVVTYTIWNSIATVPYLHRDTETGNDTVVGTKTVAIYQGFYAVSDDGTHFRVPDLRNRFIRALLFTDGTSDPARFTQKAGGYQIDSMRKHNHESNNSAGVGGTGKPTTGNEATEGAWLITAGAGEDETRGENIGQFPLVVL